MVKFLKIVIEEHGLIAEACYLIANKTDLGSKRVVWYINFNKNK